MAAAADPTIVQEIRRLAQSGDNVVVTRTAASDLLARMLTVDDICAAIVDWIDAGERVKPTVLHSFPGLQGEAAYEMKPRIDGIVFYVKVALIKLHQPGEYLLLISTHPDH
jgi:hypothetical protein